MSREIFNGSDITKYVRQNVNIKQMKELAKILSPANYDAIKNLSKEKIHQEIFCLLENIENAEKIKKIIPDWPVSSIKKKTKSKKENINYENIFDKNKKNQKLLPYQAETLSKLILHSKDSLFRGLDNALLIQLPTGSGKTRVVNTYIRDHVLNTSNRVLWIAPSHELLYQACKELIEISDEAHINKLTCFAKSKQIKNQIGISQSADGQVVYCTLQTVALKNSRAESELRLKGFDIVIIDEVHIGVGEKGQGNLKRWYKDSLFVGLSATPKQNNKGKYLCQYVYKDLVKLKPRVLADCTIEHEKTGIVIDTSMFKSTYDSLKKLKILDKELSTNSERTEHIAKYWNKKVHGKTLIFAIDKKHCEEIFDTFKKNGVAVGFIHSDVPSWEDVVEEFRNNKFDVLINVEQLCHGIDIPDIKTIFIARPTSSDILFTQMVGRGARCRLNEGQIKEEFFVVDFTDNILDEELQKMLTGHDKVFKGAASAKGKDKEYLIRVDRSNRSSLLNYDPTGDLRYIGDKSKFLKEIKGFPIRKSQAFGVEIELTHADYSLDEIDGENDKDLFYEQADRLLDIIDKTLKEKLNKSRRVNMTPIYQGDKEKNYENWNIEFDGSCGLEVISPVLVDEEGFEELAVVMRAIEEAKKILGLESNFATGLHVHFGWALPDFEQGFCFLKNIIAFEPAIAELLSPSRLMEFNPVQKKYDSYNEKRPNEYCVPLNYAIPHKTINQFHKNEDYEALFAKLAEFTNFRSCVTDPHYLAVNFENLLSETGTVEIRYHQSTTDFERVAGWISLWMTMLWSTTKNDSFSIQKSDQYLPLPDGSWSRLYNCLTEDFKFEKDDPIVKSLMKFVQISKVNWENRFPKKKIA